MTRRRRRGPDTLRLLRERAGSLCEFCHTQERWQYVPFTIDHVHPLNRGGKDGLENLALACFHCNRHKSNLVAALDPETGNESPLFNPRRDLWSQHFAWSKDLTQIVGLTPTGRATALALHMNRERIRAIRAADVAVGRHPPSGDPVAGDQ